MNQHCHKKRFTTSLANFYQLQVVTTSYSFSTRAATILRVTLLGVDNCLGLIYYSNRYTQPVLVYTRNLVFKPNLSFVDIASSTRVGSNLK